MFYNEGTEYTEKGRQLHGAMSDPEEALDLGTVTETGDENIKPSIIKKIKFRSVLEGEVTAFRCKLVAKPDPTILWFHNNRQIQKEHRRRIHTVSKMHVHLTSLTINDIRDKDSGSYKVMAINPEGSAESTASLLVSLREEQDANYVSLSRQSNRSHSSLDSLVDQTKERKFRVDLRCVGSPFDKKGKPRGRPRPKSAVFRTMYFRTSSPSRPPEKDSKLETASERARSPLPMFERHERFSDRYSDIYCDRLTGHDRYSDRFSDKFSDRCSDRYSDKFSDTDSLHGEVRAKLTLLQKAVKQKKRLSISTMSSSEFDLESVTSEPSYTDYAERHRAKSREQGEGAASKGSADFQSRLERITGLGAQSVEPSQPRSKHSFQPQSRSRAIQMMRGELPLEDIIKREETKAEISKMKMEETLVSKEMSGTEEEYEHLAGSDDEKAKVKAKEPFVLQWLEAGEASKTTEEVKALHKEPASKASSRTKGVKEMFLSDDVPQDIKNIATVQQSQPSGMSTENIFEGECLETEGQVLAQRVRRWQEDVQLDQPRAITTEARESHVHEPEDKIYRPAAKTQKHSHSELVSSQEKMTLQHESESLISGEEALQQVHKEAGISGRPKEKASHFHKPETDLAAVKTHLDSSARVSRSLSKEKLLSEHVAQGEMHSSREEMSELKSESVQLINEGLTQQGLKQQQGHPDIVTPELSLLQDKKTQKHMAEVSEEETFVQPARKWKQREEDTEKTSHFHRPEDEIYKDPRLSHRESSSAKAVRSPKEKRLSERKKELHLSRERINELKNESERYISEEEALTQRIMKWQQDVFSEQEHAAPLEPEWTTDVDTTKETEKTSERSQPLSGRTPKEKFFEDVSSQGYVDSSQIQLESISHEDKGKVRTESDYLVSEEEALATRIKKWQQDILSEQEQEENVELESNWTVTEHLPPLTQKTETGLESSTVPQFEGAISQALLETDITSVLPSEVPQHDIKKVTETQSTAHEKVAIHAYHDEPKGGRVPSEQEPPTIVQKQVVEGTVRSGAPVFITTLVPNLDVRRGEMTELRCQFHGDPQPSVSWLKDGEPIVRDPDFDVRIRANSSTLTIYYPTKDHQGTFSCNIWNKYGKASTSCTIEVTDGETKTCPETPQEIKVTDESELTEEQMIEAELESFLDPGLDKKFTLQVPQATIYVPHTSDSLHSSPVEIRITAPTPTLDITEEATDTCEPSEKVAGAPVDENTSQTMKHKFTFSFEDASEAPQILRELENISFSEGQTALLECIISGEPAPSAIWSHNDVVLDPSSDKYMFEEHDKSFRLYIHNFCDLDSGTYRCTAINKLGQVESVADVSFDSSTLDSGFSSLATIEMGEQTRSLGLTTDSSPAVRAKTLSSPSSGFKELPKKGEEGVYKIDQSITTEDTNQSSMGQFPVPLQNVGESDEPSVLRKDAPKVKQAVESDVPVLTGCGLQSSGADVKVSRIKKAFEIPETPIVEPDETTDQSTVESFYPIQDIPEVELDIEQCGVQSSFQPLVAGKVSPSSMTPDFTAFVEKDVLQSTEGETERDGSFEEPPSTELHHFVSLAKVTEFQQSPTLIRPQAILPDITRNIIDSPGIPRANLTAVQEGKFVRPGGSHLEKDVSESREISTETKEDAIVSPKTSTISIQGATIEYKETLDSGQKGTRRDALSEVSKPGKSTAQDFVAEGPQQQPQRAARPGLAGVRKLEEEEVTFSAVYDYYNPPSDWGRPLSPESEMSIEVGSSFSEEMAEVERFYTPASSTEVSQFPKSPESFQTSTETPSGVMTPPEYPFSPVERKRPPSSSSDGLYSDKFFRSPDDEGIETTPPVFTIDERMILQEGRGLLGLGALQEKVQGIPPAFLKPLTKRRVFEGDTLRFSAEVFGLPSPEVKWFRNKTRLVPDDRTSIERDGDNIALEIQNIEKADQGEYICEAVNYVGEAKSVALVVVTSHEARMIPAPPAVTHQHVIEFDVEEDEDESRSPSPQEILLEVELDENEVKEFEKQVKIVTIPEYTADNKSMIISLDVLPSMYEEGAVDFISQESEDLKIAFEVIEMPPRFINPICDIETPENTTVMFECSLMGIPSPVVSWFKGNMKIPHDKKKYFHSSDGDNHFLKILKTNTQDSGIYTCRAINVVGETLCRASLMVLNPQAYSGKARGRELTAVSLGSAKIQPQKFDLVVGNSSFDGEQTSEIELEFEFQQEADESQKALRLVAMTENEVSEEGQKYVSINFDVFAEPSKEDKIEFKGKSTNTCSFHFQVTETPPKFIIPLQNVASAVGTPVLLQCLVSGKPNPSAEWFKDGAPITNPRYIIQEKAPGHFNLLITNVAQSDAGEFKCVIQNKEGSIETVSLLKVF